VLEVGCGTGQLAAELAARAGHVDAVDRDPGMIAIARQVAPANVTCVLTDVLELPLEPDAYDAVVSLSALHHMDPAPALGHLAAALRPGGVLAVVALPRTDLPRELPVEAAATVWHHLLGAGLAVTHHPWRTAVTRPAHPGGVPVKDPQLTTRQVREAAAAVLPGVRVRRLLLWRYLLVWRKP
jgi:SAM-dependent methyltransferase